MPQAMDEPLRIRTARIALAMCLGLSLGLAGRTIAQENVGADIAEAEAAAGFRLGDDLGTGEARPSSAYNWGSPVAGEAPAAPPRTGAERLPGDDPGSGYEPLPGDAWVDAAIEDDDPVDIGAEYLVGGGPQHLEQRAARYRFGAVAKAAKDQVLEGFGAGVFFQGPNWYRDTDIVDDPDPKLIGGWRFALTSHSLDYQNAPSGTTALQNEEALILAVGVGGDYFFNRQFRQRRDAQGNPMWTRSGDPILMRQNSPYLSAWLESVHFMEISGTQPSTQNPDGGFHDSAQGVALGAGYQFKDKMRIGLEHSFIGGPFSSSQVYIGSSF